jgi:PEP-CTERM motif-containing protein
MKLALRALSVPCLAVLFAAAPLAHAASITATVYQNIPDPGNSGDVANQTADFATFTIGGSGINFDSDVTSYSNITAFLNNPTYTTESATFNPNAGVDNIEIIINGTLGLNTGANSFEVGHDDGVVLTVAGFGTVVNAPGPTSLVTTPFNVNNPGAANNFAFELEYAECCGAPADLIFDVNNVAVGATPEPSTFCLFGTGLLAAAGIVRRRMTA